jgi:hypothetical protein
MIPEHADVPEPEQTLTFPVIEADTETLEALPAVTETVPASRPFPYIAIGDWMTTAKPGFDIPPCGHCGAVFTDAPPDILTVTRPLGGLRHLAYEAGWGYDLGLKWTCPECREAQQQAAAGAYAQLAPDTYPDILRESDMKTRATMTACGRYPWDYDDWRKRFRPRPERCEPDPAADSEVAA